MTRYIYILPVMLALVGATAAADEIVTAGGVTYSNAKITAVDGGKLVWEQKTAGGDVNTISKDIETVIKVNATGQDSFNDAEGLLGKGKWADAVKAYDQALDRAGEVDWIKQFIAIRRLKALNKAGMIDRGATEWLALLGASKDAKFAMTLIPTKGTPKKSQMNDDAIKALKGKLDEDAKGPAAGAIRKLLLSLYEAQGDRAAAKDMADQLGGGTSTSETGTGNNGEKPPEGTAPSAGDQFAAAIFQIKNGNPKQAYDNLNKRIKDYSPALLPKALLLMGKAQVAMANAKDVAKDEKAKLLAGAGLDFMRVATFYPTIPEAAESIYLAGMVNLDLGNRVAARAAFNRAITYRESPFAAQAQNEIANMEKGAPPVKAPAKGSGKEGGETAPEKSTE